MMVWHPWQFKKVSPVGRFELPAKQPILSNFSVNVPNWQCCLAGSSKTVPRILIISIVLGAEFAFYAKSFATYAPQKLT